VKTDCTIPIVGAARGMGGLPAERLLSNGDTVGSDRSTTDASDSQIPIGRAAATPFRLAVSFLGGFRTPALSRRTAMVNERPASENLHICGHSDLRIAVRPTQEKVP
jgi:hypothetical protein